MHHVVIGAGPAGVTACDTLRRLDPGAQITLIGDEPEPPYSRMAIPYYLIDKIGEDGTYLRRKADHYERERIEVRRARVSAVSPSEHRLALADGTTVDYDRMLIASGSSPVLPPIPGIESEGVMPCWTLADGRGIAQRAQPGSRVVLLGAGFIGCIILEALAARGVDLTVVEPMDRMVPRMMNQSAGGLIKRWCETKGVRVLTGLKATSIEPGPPLDVILDDGQTLPADLVIRATGVRPNVDFLEGSDVEVDQGVLVSECLQTSADDVFAAGDVCRGRDLSTGTFRVQAIQPTAVEHGRVAAHNMVSDCLLPHSGNLNMNVLDTLGLISSSFGLWEGAKGGDSVELLDEHRFRYINIQFKDDRVVGATSLGLTDHVGVIRGLIQGNVRLGAWKERLMRDPTRLMEAYLSAAQAAA
ncbi:MAG: FAD-dependent oxidoreductase [Chromatiaceae bacterium]